MHLLMGPSELEEEEDEIEFIDCVEETEEAQLEEAIISLFTSKDANKVKTMKFKGYVGSIPICALIDSGSTHSFVNSTVLQGQQFPITKSTPMTVVVANGHKMVTETSCNALKFSIQGNEFKKDMRILDVKGYDLILGFDWLTELGPMLIDWKKGVLKFKQGSKEVKLQVCTETAEISLCEGAFSFKLEENQGSEILVACLFKVETVDEITPEMESELILILDQYHNIFVEPTFLPPYREVDHQITLLPNTQPMNLRPYRHSYFQKLELEKIIAELLKNGFIQPSTFPFASPVILVKKKDNTWRLCVDYRKLNSCTVKNRYPIPIIEDLLDELHGSKVYSKINLRAGYHQIRMIKGDIPKTTFRTHEGHYEYTVMPFGLTNAPATFKALMNQVFKPYLRKFILVFFDDILVYSPDLDTHKKHLALTFEVLKKHQLFAKRSKCAFGMAEVEYLGHIISHKGVATDPGKVEAMLKWPVPKTTKN
ncbi:polyprotein [Rhynchospora pubera]|uniref:Polyprotein n=1 Tax=Rhynchospora pubera TaxID=906938 RepID=A0AAV8GX64_9POAL|nr:polyprotein [Rhynchospora pubera]